MADPDDDAVALARRVADELGSTLQAGPCCSPQATRLRHQIVNLLRCDACQDMSFRVNNIPSPARRSGPWLPRWKGRGTACTSASIRS